MKRGRQLGRSIGAALRRPRAVVAELAAVALAGVALSVAPQVGEPAWARLREDHPAAATLLRAFSLDRVLTSWWFLLVLLAAGASLSLVALDQWRRALRQWREPLAEASFAASRYRRTFDRPAAQARPRAEFRTRGRLGLLGAPLFHTGLLLAAVAGLLRAGLAVEAVAFLVEGQELPPGPAGWAAQRPGWVARPLGLDRPVRLERIEPRRYASGELEQISAVLSVDGERRRISINDQLDLPGGVLRVRQEHGPAAVVEVVAGGPPERMGVILSRAEDGVYQGRAVAPGGTDVRLSAPDRGGLPQVLRVRVLRRGALLFVGDLAPGQGVEWSGGERLGLLALTTWVEVLGTRDPSWWVLVAAAAVAVAGALLMFAVVRVDTAVVVQPTASGERVLVALRAQRLAPLFAERFEELVRREGGPAH